MPRIYRPLPPIASRNRSVSATPRTRMELSVRDDDTAQEMISGSNMLYSAGTHRSPQCKDSLRTPGPGAYRTPSTFPVSDRDEAPHRQVHRRSPAWSMNLRNRGRVADIGNPFNIVPPVVGLFQRHAAGKTDVDILGKTKMTVNTMP